jgi:hypothetical protein
MSETEILDIIDRFNRAWNNHDLDAALALVSDECIFENTSPAPDGEVFTGKEALRTAWKPVFDQPAAHFDTEEIFCAGDRVVQRWRYDWGEGHIRGVDVMRVAGGLVTEKLSYVKG